MRLVIPLLLFAGLAAQAQVPLIVDTDAGADDLMALLWLLRQPEVRIEAITAVNGLAHPEAGADTILRLLEAGGRGSIPVYAGADRPVEGTGAFPPEWRRASDGLLRDEFPAPKRRREPVGAAKFLSQRLRDSRRPVRVLALGPLTNLARAIALEPRTGPALQELIWMGGAVEAKGNVAEAPAAEWNAFIDPAAVERVLAAGWRVRIVPLDATNRVPIGPGDLQFFEEEARDWEASLILKLLQSEAASIRAGRYFAWDILAAMAVLKPRITGERMMALAVRKRSNERGRLVRVEGARPNALVAMTADAGEFSRLFRSLAP